VYSTGGNSPKEARDFMGRGATLKIKVPGLIGENLQVEGNGQEK
jgi:hypothetical protein